MKLTQDNTVLGIVASDLEKVFPKAITVAENYGFPDFKHVNFDQLYNMHYGATQKLVEIVEKQQEVLSTLLDIHKRNNLM